MECVLFVLAPVISGIKKMEKFEKPLKNRAFSQKLTVKQDITKGMLKI
jgi:hypothetical protein